NLGVGVGGEHGLGKITEGDTGDGSRAGDRRAREEIAPTQIGRFGSNFRRRNRSRFPDQHGSPHMVHPGYSPRLLFTHGSRYGRQTWMGPMPKAHTSLHTYV